ncbi:MAG: hypothetical protein LBP59_08155 [Planctomycetaceae bacterium]|nr:hypothetical protein [Planctomycetaceae bacterium]
MSEVYILTAFLFALRQSAGETSAFIRNFLYLTTETPEFTENKKFYKIILDQKSIVILNNVY